jgi:hypothetical protein
VTTSLTVLCIQHIVYMYCIVYVGSYSRNIVLMLHNVHKYDLMLLKFVLGFEDERELSMNSYSIQLRNLGA